MAIARGQELVIGFGGGFGKEGGEAHGTTAGGSVAEWRERKGKMETSTHKVGFKAQKGHAPIRIGRGHCGSGCRSR